MKDRERGRKKLSWKNETSFQHPWRLDRWILQNTHTKICSLIIGSYVSSRRTVDWHAPNVHLKPERDDLVSTALESSCHKRWVLITHESKLAWACGVGVTWRDLFSFHHLSTSTLFTGVISGMWMSQIQTAHTFHSCSVKFEMAPGSWHRWLNHWSLSKLKVDRVVVLLLQQTMLQSLKYVQTHTHRLSTHVVLTSTRSTSSHRSMGVNPIHTPDSHLPIDQTDETSFLGLYTYHIHSA